MLADKGIVLKLNLHKLSPILRVYCLALRKASPGMVPLNSLLSTENLYFETRHNILNIYILLVIDLMELAEGLTHELISVVRSGWTEIQVAHVRSSDPSALT